MLDRAGAKGTGKWMSQLALDLGVPSTLVTEAVYARCLSAMKDSRVRASRILSGPTGTYQGDKKEFVEQIRNALYASKICSYAQGFVQMQAAAQEHDWPLDFGSCALLWRGGCIIRAVFLQRIKDAFDADPNLENLLLAPYFTEAVEKAQASWRHVVKTAAELGIPTPAFSAALWRTTTGTAARPCRRTCCRRSATTSAPTPSSAPTSPAARCSTPSG